MEPEQHESTGQLKALPTCANMRTLFFTAHPLPQTKQLATLPGWSIVVQARGVSAKKILLLHHIIN